jgi:glycosyltransferase involved in cell wall biosynthesis
MNQSTISKFYVAADVGVVISREDPSPKSMNEMLNFELPVIVTNVVGTASDLVKPDVNGFIIGVGDTATLSDRIEFLMCNRDAVASMGKASLDIVNKWNYEEDAKGIIEAFENVTKKKIEKC